MANVPFAAVLSSVVLAIIWVPVRMGVRLSEICSPVEGLQKIREVVIGLGGRYWNSIQSELLSKRKCTHYQLGNFYSYLYQHGNASGELACAGNPSIAYLFPFCH